MKTLDEWCSVKKFSAPTLEEFNFKSISAAQQSVLFTAFQEYLDSMKDRNQLCRFFIIHILANDLSDALKQTSALLTENDSVLK